MACCMTFPATFEEFAEDYKIVDSQEVYTNGTELIPIFRVKQWLQHEQAFRDTEVKRGEWFLLDECSNEGVYCSVCHKKVYRKEYANQKVKSKFCPNCGADMRGGKGDGLC